MASEAEPMKLEGQVVIWAGIVQNMTFSANEEDFSEEGDGQLYTPLCEYPAGQWELRKATLIVAPPAAGGEPDANGVVKHVEPTA